MQENNNSQDMAEPENIKRGKPRREKKPPKKITEKYLYNSGLAYLQRFPTSTPHFRRIMGRKIDRSCNYHKEQDREACIALLDGAVATFVRMGLLNDDAWLTAMVGSLRRRGLSSQAILSKLQQKGMTQGNILSVLRDLDGSEDAELSAAIRLMRKKRLGCFRKGPDDNRNKELAALARAGFGFDIAQKALSLSSEEAEEILASIRL